MKKLAYTTVALLSFCAWQPSAFAQTADSILSDTHIVSQSFVEAEVIRVKPIARTITVKGEKRGETRQFNVPEGARISVNGQQARLRDLRRGDNIRVSFVKRDAGVVVEQIRMPDAPVTLTQRRANPVVAEATPAMLPSTASFLPIILVLGLFSLAGAALVRSRRA